MVTGERVVFVYEDQSLNEIPSIIVVPADWTLQTLEALAKQRDDEWEASGSKPDKWIPLWRYALDHGARVLTEDDYFTYMAQ